MPSPTPTWTPGTPIKSPVQEMISIDSSTTPPRELYPLIIGSIIPRPIAFVSTCNSAGIGNLAPYSFFNGVCSNPPCLMISVTRKRDTTKKDTLVNIESTGQFVINMVSEWMIEAAHHCSAEYPYGVDEMQKAGLTALPSQKVKPPRVKESPIQLECELYKTLEIGDGGLGSATIVVGKILLIHIHKAAYRDGKIIIDELKPISRLGGTAYGRTERIFDLDPAQPIKSE